VQGICDKAFAGILKETTGWSERFSPAEGSCQDGVTESKERAADLRALQHALDEKIDKLDSRYVSSGKSSPENAKDEAELRTKSEAAELRALASEVHKTYLR
jgi:hypothetical protein